MGEKKLTKKQREKALDSCQAECDKIAARGGLPDACVENCNMKFGGSIFQTASFGAVSTGWFALLLCTVLTSDSYTTHMRCLHEPTSTGL